MPTVKSSASGGAARPSTDVRNAGAPFSVSAANVHNTRSFSAVGEGFGLEGVSSRLPAGAGGSGDDTPGVATFYGSVLTVWSAADDKRAKAIRKELGRLAKARATARTAATNKNINNDGEDIEDDAELTSALGHSILPDNNAFFMPYAICIVSRYPIYNLLGDWNKAAWFKYSRNIEMHNKLMAAILRHPAPRIGETFRLPSPDEDLAFVCTFPARSTGAGASSASTFPCGPSSRRSPSTTCSPSARSPSHQQVASSSCRVIPPSWAWPSRRSSTSSSSAAGRASHIKTATPETCASTSRTPAPGSSPSTLSCEASSSHPRRSASSTSTSTLSTVRARPSRRPPRAPPETGSAENSSPPSASPPPTTPSRASTSRPSQRTLPPAQQGRVHLARRRLRAPRDAPVVGPGRARRRL